MIQDFINSLMSISFHEYLVTVKPLAFFVAGMVVYSIFIFKFYRFLGRRDIIRLGLQGKAASYSHSVIQNFFKVIFYILEYMIVLPVVIFFWFVVLATLLTFLSKNQSFDTILLVAISVVGAVRVTSYYNEDLSKDLAKMLPFALLGVFIVDISYFDLSSSFLFVGQALEQVSTLVYFLGFIVVLEMTLRLFRLLLFPFAKDSDEDEN